MNCLTNCWWQILVAGIAYFAVGAVWFNPKVLGNTWQKAHKLSFTEEQMRKGMAPTMVVTFFCTLILTAIICYMICHTAASCTAGGCCNGLWHSIKIGLLLGGGTAGASIGMAYVYQMKPRNAYITDIGYHVIGSVVAATVLHFTC